MLTIMWEVEPYGGWFLAERRKGGHKYAQENQLLDRPNLHFSEVILESITFAQLSITITLCLSISSRTLNSSSVSDLVTPGSQLIFTELSGTSLEHHRPLSSPSSTLPSQ